MLLQINGSKLLTKIIFNSLKWSCLSIISLTSDNVVISTREEHKRPVSILRL